MTRRVLIVDDEGNIRRMMRLTLEADGYEVEDAADGSQGLALFGDGARFDAVVLDQKMPGMDGIETLRQMLRRSPRATIIMVTAFGSIELAVDAMKAGARDFLRKPLTPALLRDAVRAALSKGSDSPGHDGTPQAAELPAERREPAPPGAHEVWTVNGFFIRTLPSSADLAPALEHRFAVRHVGGGPYGEVLVTISSAEARRIATLSGRALPGPAFWRNQAERALMNHMFNAAALPPGNHLLINQLPDEVVLLARNWRD